ncbi:hypothetical protein CAPTEDRAFT_168664 [Capitella teleta]|uniref:Uncharacterized protein n=1 Tax=Capitella teleta TaxID=283909 RepID=R7UKK7_CAPTE|nr:hypothetical protein CAPTEDRAFT_168664 [Capitella teleta]|eukprot:ELU06613.1 hypothetical protein CAPTEDRAFT_168664 [Capitella teleta]
MGEDSEDDYADEREQQGHGIQKVVLVTPYRGGSTFLGELFNQHPDAFYWFEPLTQIAFDFKHSIKANSPFQYDNGTLRELPGSFSKALRDTLSNILNCRLSEVSQKVLKHYFVTKMDKSKKMAPYRECLNGSNNHEKVKTCLPKLQTKCVTSSLRVIKTIRYLVHMTDDLLKQDPTVKVIHYVRDPRGILLSVWELEKKRGISYDEQMQHASTLCQRLHVDSKAFQRLKTLHPDNFYQQRYEDLSNEPEKFTKDIFRFLDVVYPPSVSDWIEKNTRVDGGRVGGMSVIKRNSSAVASRWHTVLSAEEQMIITSECSQVLKDYKYSI